MKKRRIIKEAGFELTPEEQSKLSKLSPALRMDVRRAILSTRKSGGNPDVSSAVKDLMKFPEYSANKELSSFLSVLNGEIPAPVAFKNTQSQGIPAPINFQQPQSNSSSITRPKPSIQGLRSKQNPSNQTPQNPASNKQRNVRDELAARKANRERLSQPRLNMEAFGQVGQSNPNTQKIFQSIRNLRQEDLVALKGMLDGLLGN